ncbi:MAG: hypothetical protein ACP5JQ_03490 [Caldimicrobium sp.]
MEKMFLTIKWMEKIFRLFLEKERFFIKDKEILFTPKLFLATLLRMYKTSLWEKILKEYFQELKPEEKELCERGFDYLYAQDLFSLEFSKWYQEMLLGRSYTEREYFYLAYEFLNLKEQLRKQIQIPLLDRIKKLCIHLEESLETKQNPLEEDLKKLKKLYSFFSWVLVLEPTKISEIVERGEKLLKEISNPLEFNKEAILELKKEAELEFLKGLKNFLERAKIREGFK